MQLNFYLKIEGIISTCLTMNSSVSCHTYAIEASNFVLTRSSIEARKTVTLSYSLMNTIKSCHTRKQLIQQVGTIKELRNEFGNKYSYLNVSHKVNDLH